jgi:protein O-GlcNAc transferase
MAEPERKPAGPAPGVAVWAPERGDLYAAVAGLNAIASADQKGAETQNERGKTFRTAGKLAEALACFQEALRLWPDYAEACTNAGVALVALGKAEQALEYFHKAVLLKPDDPAGYNNLGTTLLMLERLDEAEAYFDQALRLRPDYLKARGGRSIIFIARRQVDEAIASFREVIRLEPNWGDAHENLATALTLAGRIEESIASYQQAMRLQPEHARAHSGLLLTLQCLPQLNASHLLAEHQLWARRHAGIAAEAPPVSDRHPDRRLRIGYVTGDLRDHPIAPFIEPILAAHDRQAVEVYCYADVPAPDQSTERLRRHADVWRSLFGMSDAATAHLVRADRIDILVDLAGHSSHPRLRAFAHRPAPVQATYLGYPGTTGLSAIDYRITDSVTDPPGEPEVHSERLIRLPGCFCCYSPPESAPPVNPSPALATGRVTFGSLHSLAKLNDQVLNLWCELLRAVPSARLLLARDTLSGQTKETLARRFLDRGIAPERLEMRRVWGAPGNHQRHYADIDISLDTFPLSAHTTACESLWMGAPIVTLYGDRHASRMTASILTAVDLAELVARTPTEYVEQAVRLAAEPETLSTLRAGLRDHVRRSPLCDGPTFTRALEQLYRQMWKDCCAAPGR